MGMGYRQVAKSGPVPLPMGTLVPAYPLGMCYPSSNTTYVTLLLRRWAIDDVVFEMDNVLVSDNDKSDTDSSMDSGSLADTGMTSMLTWKLKPKHS
jgi:hypothetical protein